MRARLWLHGLLLGLVACALGCQTIRSYDYGCPGVYSGTRSYNQRLTYLPLDGKLFFTLDLPFTLIADTLALPVTAFVDRQEPAAGWVPSCRWAEPRG